jgi:hypothetical protein
MTSTPGARLKPGRERIGGALGQHADDPVGLHVDQDRAVVMPAAQGEVAGPRAPARPPDRDPARLGPSAPAHPRRRRSPGPQPDGRRRGRPTPSRSPAASSATATCGGRAGRSARGSARRRSSSRTRRRRRRTGAPANAAPRAGWRSPGRRLALVAAVHAPRPAAAARAGPDSSRPRTWTRAVRPLVVNASTCSSAR